MTVTNSRNYSIIIIWVLTISLVNNEKRLREEFSWKTVDYEFSTPSIRRDAIDAGAYIPTNNLIYGIERWSEKLFLTVPRFKPGVPSTLNYINIDNVDTKSPLLKPYPSWEANDYLNKTSKQRTMISVVSIQADNCNRLWALDTGIYDEFGLKKIDTLPSLFVFNLNDNAIHRKYTLKEDEVLADSKFRSIIVDVTSSNCDQAYAYIADTRQGLVVYSWETNMSHRLVNNYFSFEPIWGNFRTSIGNLHQLNDGIMAMALTAADRNGFRNLLFHPLVGINEFTISTKLLHNRTLASSNLTEYHFLGDRGQNMQSSASFLDAETGVLFYTMVVKNGVACWNSYRGEDFSSLNQGIIEIFSNRMSYPNDLKIDQNGTLWVLTNRLLDFTFEKADNKTPYRIYSGVAKQIIKETPCAEL